MWKTRRLRARPAGSLEAPFSARSCLRLPRASASLGQSAAWAALAGHIGLVFHLGDFGGMRGVVGRVVPTKTAGKQPPFTIDGDIYDI